MKPKSDFFPRLEFVAVIIFMISGTAMPGSVQDYGNEVQKLQNPVTVQYIRTKLKKTTPRIILTPGIEKNLKIRLKTDPVVKNYYAAMKLNAENILSSPVLTRNVIGRRLLSTSRSMLQRMTILSMVYRIDKEPAVLEKINEELIAVCNFSDWNPSHFLDVAEISSSSAPSDAALYSMVNGITFLTQDEAMKLEPARMKVHQVKAGETWEGIINKYYNKNEDKAKLAEYNGLKPTERPEPGIMLKIPPTLRFK